MPPIFPPTPTSASSDNQDIMHYFENRMVHDYHDSMAFPSCPIVMQSPTYTTTNTVSDSIYDNYFKQEGLYQYSSCMAPCLPLEGINPPQFEGTPPPLTPQSSFCSSDSPLSHASIHSPESAAMTPDLETARPLSQGSMYSPQVGDVAHTPMLTYSTSSSACTSPLQHTPAPSSLDMTSPLDLVASTEPVCSADFSYNMISPLPLYPHSKMGVDSAYPMSAPPYHAVTLPMLGGGAGYPHDISSYSHYDFELHPLMADPSELLTKSLSDNIKPALSKLQTQSPPAAIIQ